MKIAIITLYNKTYNYGAQLQTYALQKKLSDMGHFARVLCYKWYDYKTRDFYANLGSEVLKKFSDFSDEIPHVGDYTPENIRECVADYDAFICGSDQIWSNIISLRYVLPQLALSFVPNNKLKIAYAASMGGARTSDSVEKIIKPFICELDAISVREKSAVPYVSKISGKNVRFVLDPTFIIKSNEWEAISDPPKAGEYIFAYSIGSARDTLIPVVNQLSVYLGCEIRGVYYSKEDIVGPKDWVGLIKNARYVVTNSFHAVVFSVLFHKQFIALWANNDESSLGSNTRLRDLLDVFGLSDRFVSPRNINIQSFMGNIKPIDYEAVENTLNELRLKSLSFLQEALSLQKTDRAEKNGLWQTPQNKALPDPYHDYLKTVPYGEFDAEYRALKKELDYDKRMSDINVPAVRRDLVARINSLTGEIKLCSGFESVIVYGAGEIGRSLVSHIGPQMRCFIDRAENVKAYGGYPVFRLDEEGLINHIVKEKTVVIVTPIWDLEEISERLMELFPEITIVSVENLFR